MGKEWTIPAKEPKKEKTISEQMNEIINEFCDSYCKYPEFCRTQKKDPDEAEDLLYLEYCANCPMNRW